MTTNGATPGAPISAEHLHLRHIAWLDETGRHTLKHDAGLALCLRNGWCVLRPGEMGLDYTRVSITKAGKNAFSQMERDAARGTGADAG